MTLFAWLLAFSEVSRTPVTLFLQKGSYWEFLGPITAMQSVRIPNGKEDCV